MSEVILRVDCHEPEGVVEREVRFAPFTEERLRFFWEKLSKFPTLFNRHLENEDDFIHTFISQDANGDLKANGIIWEVDDVGIFYLTDIYPEFQATGHFTFWDQRIKGREALVLEMVKYTFEEFGLRRIIAEIPLYAKGTYLAAERIGFVKEGRMRKVMWFDGEWWDCNLYSILKEEIDGLLETKHRGAPAEVPSDTSGG